MTVSETRGVVIGTAGHVDHGKTALVERLTGVRTDRWREEQERGLTIDLGFAALDLAPGLETAVVDVPGHEDFLKNMLAGATGVDVLLLVVAADEGPMPQTVEHLSIAHLLDIRTGVVALTKRDRVDPEWLDLVTDATRDLLAEWDGSREWPIVPVSSTSGEGLEALREALVRVVAGRESRRAEDLFRLPVDRSFSVHGTGTVVTGTVWSGAVAAGSTVRLLPSGTTARVRGLEVHGERRDRVAAGRRCALALVGVAADQTARGTVLVTDPAWEASRRLGGRLETLARPGRPIEPGQRVRLYLGTREVMARVYPKGRDVVSPGESAWAVLALESPLTARARDRAIIRFYSPVTTIGGVRICELDPPRRWDSRTDAWGEILDGGDLAALDAAVRLSGTRGLSARSAPMATGLPPAVIAAAFAESNARALGDRWFSAVAREQAIAAVIRVVSALHRARPRAPGVPVESVRSTLNAESAPALVDEAIAACVAGGALELDGPRIALPGIGAVLTAAEEQALQRLRVSILEGDLQPPLVKDLQRGLGIPRDLLDDLLRLLETRGHTRSITPEIHISTGALERLIARSNELLAAGVPLPPTVFKEEFGLSRKYLIPLLEFLDRLGVTRRSGEGRVAGTGAREARA